MSYGGAAALREPKAGFGLVELIVALLILSIGLLALTGAAAVAQRSLTGARVHEAGAETAALVLDSLMREAAPEPGARRHGPVVARWGIREDSTAMRIDLTISVLDGSRARRLTFRAIHHAR
jgi:prepilin-type N-terminal cleavage/methylation domain-containing protein